MPELLAIVGGRQRERRIVLEKLLSELAGKGLKVGVAVHRIISAKEAEEIEDWKRYSRAGACQVMVTRGKGIGFPGKGGGLTPLRRVAARYFNSVDLLLAEGYFDPVPKVEVCLNDNPQGIACLDDPHLRAVVFRRQKPVLPIPAFLLSELPDLAALLASGKLRPK